MSGKPQNAATTISSMWLIAVVPAVAAAVVGLVTGLSPELARWKRILVVLLTLSTIGAVIANQWWEHSEKVAQEGKRVATVETLGSLIAAGNEVMNKIASSPSGPIPFPDINDWSSKCEAFLHGLGDSYVVRFNSAAGLNSFSWNNMSSEQNTWLNNIQRHVVRLHEFSQEFSGQLPKGSH
jgi:hypothetical protein